MKTQKTKDLEKLLAQHFNSRNDFYVFECTLGWYGSEIVDCVMYNCQREIYCYEIKQSVQDFHSKNKLSFFGNKNYFVMPYSLYEKVKNEIPYGIGVYVAIDRLEEKTGETTTTSILIKDGAKDYLMITFDYQELKKIVEDNNVKEK